MGRVHRYVRGSCTLPFNCIVAKLLCQWGACPLCSLKPQMEHKHPSNKCQGACQEGSARTMCAAAVIRSVKQGLSSPKHI